MCSPINGYFVVRYGYILKKIQELEVEQSISRSVKVFYLFFSYTAFTSGGKAKWKIYQQYGNFYFEFLRIVHQIAFVLQVRFHTVVLSQEYAALDVYLLLMENLSEFSCAEFFSTGDKYFLPFEEPRIPGVTVYNFLSSKSTSILPWVPEATRLLNPAGQTSAGFSKRVASGTQGTSILLPHKKPLNNC